MQRYVFDRRRLKEVAKANIDIRAAFFVVLVIFAIPGWVGSSVGVRNIWIDGVLYQENFNSTFQTIFTTVLPLVLGYWATSYFMISYVNYGQIVNSLDVLKEANFDKFVPYIAKVVVAHIFTILWTFLFIVPGLIKVYSYALVPYLAVDRPELGILETLKESSRLMNGYKADTFVLDLSFFGWSILNSLTFNILSFWYIPYRELTKAGLYFNIINHNTDYANEILED